jgi:hypothetical protein
MCTPSCDSFGATHATRGLHHLPGQRLAIVLAQHVRAPQMPMIAERGRESDGERAHTAVARALGVVTIGLYSFDQG